MTITRQIKEQTFVFHPSGALFWSERKMLLIADVHLGKVMHFRKAGIAVPAGSISKNFRQLESVAEFFRPEVICFLGDLFHSDINTEWTFFENWAINAEAEIVLVAGNHDIISPKKYCELGIKIFSEIVWGDFLLTHHPTIREDLFNFSGHIHPAVRLHGVGRQSLTLRCFFHRPDQLILPAFGEFTGNYVLEPTKDDCVYAITKDEVLVVCEN
jgi:DNA ligase-associated metallophosphoesterase